MRTVDMPRFRRVAKNRARLGDSVYFRYFNKTKLYILVRIILFI